MKKLSKVLLVFCILFLVIYTFISPNAKTNAKTLGELKNELASLKSKKAQKDNEKKLTQGQIASSNQSILNARNEINVNQGKVEQAKKDIVALNKDIDDTKESIKKTMSTYQLTGGSNVYLEYVFDAKSYEDLVYRYAIVEQIIDYNNEQIDKYNDLIDKNEQLQVDLANREVELNKQIDELPTALNGVNKDTSAALQKLLNSAIDDEAAASCKAAYSAVARFRSSLGKKEANLEVQSLMENVKEAKRALKIDKSKPVVGESVEDSYDYDEYDESVESYTDDYDSYDEEFTEGANLEIRSQLKALKSKYKGSMSAIKSYRRSRDYVRAYKEVTTLEATLAEYERLINSTVSTAGSVLFGFFTAWSVTFLRDYVDLLVLSFAEDIIIGNTRMSDIDKQRAHSIAVKANNIVVKCRRLIEQWSKPVDKLLKGKKLDLDDFNAYKNICLSQVNQMKKNVAKIKPCIQDEKAEFEKFAKLSSESNVDVTTNESSYDYEDFYSENESSDFDFSEFVDEVNEILAESSYDYDDEDDNTYNEYSADDLLDNLDDIL